MSTAMSARRTAAGLAAGLIAAAGLTATVAAPAQAAEQRVKIVQHNVEKKWAPIALAVQQAKTISAQGITLQEVCQSDKNTLIAQNPAWTINYKLSRADGCGTNNDVGTVAIWTGGANGAKESYDLPKDGTRNPRLTCVKYGSSPVRHICSAHLVSKDTENVRAKQTARIASITSGWITNNHAVVVAGDFNASPGKPEMDSMYALNGRGRFTEGDQTATARAGDWTATSKDGNHRKIDYVFFSRNRTGFGDAKGIQTISTDSDHELLIARADVRVG